MLRCIEKTAIFVEILTNNDMRLLSKTIKLCLLAATLWSCKESIDTSARYVFSEETVMSYLEKHPAYSSYVDLLRQVNISDISGSKVSQLLSARGVYTVFAPTNDAIQAYLEGLVKEGLISEPSWDAFTNKNKLDLESNVETITYTGGITVLEEFEVTIEGLVSGDRIAFGPTSQTLSGTKNMMLLTDMTIQIVDLQ